MRISGRSLSRAFLRLASACIVLALTGGVYWLLIRPAQLRWGATANELRRPLPEDNIVPDPAFDATRAITIEGRPEDIWPWLVQMGYGRAGFYGYDLIENPGGGRGLRSADSILPELQHPRTGDALPISKFAALQFGVIDPGRALVWRSTDNPHTGVYIWALQPVDATHTRLISRIRWRYLRDPMGRSLGLFTEFADHVAVRAILRGVRDRVEDRRPASIVLQAAEIAGWLLAFAELITGLLLILFARGSAAAWLLAMGAACLLLFVLYGPDPAWVNALLPWIYLAVAIRFWRWARRRASARPSLAECTIS